jgi:hypothetical protein
MALLHTSEIRPSKLELVQAWAPTRPWFPGAADAEIARVGAFRFDDPEGEVGVETLLVRVGDGAVVQIPLTYRGAPLEGAEAHLITTMEHSVLGDRWVYDGAGDPVYVATTATAVLTGGTQAELLVASSGSDELVRREPTALVAGSGSEESTVPAPAATGIETRDEGDVTLVEGGGIRLAIARVVSATTLAPFVGAETLAGTWAGQDAAIPLVAAWRA